MAFVTNEGGSWGNPLGRQRENLFAANGEKGAQQRTDKPRITASRGGMLTKARDAEGVSFVATLAKEEAWKVPFLFLDQ
jgi:hypothetical protein